jgi:hypothetical protein
MEPTVVVAAKGPAAPTGAPTTVVTTEGPAVPAGVLVLAVEIGRPARGSGHAAAVPTGVPAAPAACSREAAMAWMVVMAAARSTRAMPTTVEATVTTSMDGGVAMSKSWVDADRVVAGNPG